jgi:outer membrane lipoprotein carrier protein
MIEGFYCLCLFFSSLNLAPDLSTLVKRLEARYRSPRTLQAAFLERYTESGKLLRVEAGTAYFRRPGKMRWEYESPEKNLFLVDGKNAWFYVPADHTVTRVPAKESADWRTPLALLAGEMKLSRVCSKVELAPQQTPESSGDVMLSCVLRGQEPRPKTGANSGNTSGIAETRDSVYLEVAENSGDLVRILVKDSGGVGIEFRFANWRSDPPINDSLFHFQVPPGVAIVNGELPTGQRAGNPVNP